MIVPIEIDHLPKLQNLLGVSWLTSKNILQVLLIYRTHQTFSKLINPVT